MREEVTEGERVEIGDLEGDVLMEEQIVTDRVIEGDKLLLGHWDTDRDTVVHLVTLGLGDEVGYNELCEVEVWLRVGERETEGLRL